MHLAISLYVTEYVFQVHTWTMGGCTNGYLNIISKHGVYHQTKRS